MAWRKPRSDDRPKPTVEIPLIRSLPDGLQAPQLEEKRGERRKDGTFAKGSRTPQQAGGRAKANTTRLSKRLGLASLPQGADFRTYKQAAGAFRKMHVRYLAQNVGGGMCGTGPASIVATAAWQLAASRFLFDMGAAQSDPDLLLQGSRLADASRQNLLAAHELCAKEAKSRPAKPDPFWLDTAGEDAGDDEDEGDDDL